MEASKIVIAAFKMTIQNRPMHPNVLISHSDSGLQYAYQEFRKLIRYYKILESMSRKGNCWDNAIAENFFKILKSELIYQLPKFQFD